MEKLIRRNRTVSLLRMAEALVERVKCTEAEASDALIDSLLHKGRPGITSVVYDAAGTGLAVALSPEKSEGRILELLNSHWWLASDREAVRREWDRWRIAERIAPRALTDAALVLGVRFRAWELANLSEMTEQARRGVSDREDNLLTATPTTTPGYLDPSHSRYSPKLAAAVRAWLAVEDEKGKHPRQALEAWLTKNAAELRLTKDGKRNKQGIEECAKVANWKQTGGAPKTPSRK